jgi:hypothetical protein
MSDDIEKRVDELEEIMAQVLSALMSVEAIVYNVPRCTCPACQARRQSDKPTQH